MPRFPLLRIATALCFFFFDRINENIIKIQSLLFPKQIEQPYDKETGIRKNNGLFIFRSSVIRIISISLLLITVQRNEHKCQVILSTTKLLKQSLKIRFLTPPNFITHIIDEVEWDCDGDVVVGEIKSPFAILGRNHGDPTSRFLADVQLQEYFREFFRLRGLNGRGRSRPSSATGPSFPLRVFRSCRNKR